MKTLRDKKSCLAFTVIIALFIFISVVSISSIQLLQGNARVVNYVGIVRGATQKLIKEEIMGWHISQRDSSFAETSGWYPDDELVARLDGIVSELLTGEGSNNLVVLPDEAYLTNMRDVEAHWTALKDLIMQVRVGKEPSELFESSQAYFELVNKTVFSAEAYSESRVNRINTILIFINAIFILMILLGLFFYLRSLAVNKQAEALGKIAYVDALTGMNSRAKCEQEIERLKRSPANTVSVFMFDMNDLKLTNDFLGHKGGDRIIAAFGEVLKDAASEYGFIGRFGGDEFLGIFETGEESAAEAFLRKVRSGVDKYNESQSNKLETIQYAAGYVIAHTGGKDIDDIIHEADNQMYANKRRMKSSRL